jgi:hypothetical protein
MFAHFALGKSDLPEVLKEPNDSDLDGSFIEHGDEVRKELTAGGFDKIGDLKATGYASRVRGKTKTSTALATERGKMANTKLTGFLAMQTDEGKTFGNLVGMAPSSTAAKNVEAGPASKPGEYAVLSKKKPTPADIDAVATKIFERTGEYKDETPVRGKDLDETKKRLKACCDTNMATLKFQPYQYTKIEVFGVKFNASLDACVAKSKSIMSGSSTQVKPIIPEKVGSPAKNDGSGGDDGVKPKIDIRKATSGG